MNLDKPVDYSIKLLNRNVAANGLTYYLKQIAVAEHWTSV